MIKAPNLKYIGMFGTGYGRIETGYATQKGITVCNVAGYSTEGVAEFAFGIILEHIRELERGKKQAREGNYSESTYFNVYELKGKTFGIIGLGRIGARIAEIALGFGADVRYWSRTRKNKYEIKGVRYQEITPLVKECDFLSLNLAYNKDTEHFLDDNKIQQIKPAAVVINLAPMELIDINALEKKLTKGDITFILDHSDELTESQAKQLAKYQNCIMYPPIAYTTQEATLARKRMLIDNLVNFLAGSPTNKVN
jgi:lactate dehydrogenase-like 2-hydroxyacid dehydrogenase